MTFTKLALILSHTFRTRFITVHQYSGEIYICGFKNKPQYNGVTWLWNEPAIFRLQLSKSVSLDFPESIKENGEIDFSKLIVDIPVWTEGEIYEDGESLQVCGCKADFPARESFLEKIRKDYSSSLDEEELPDIDDFIDGFAWFNDERDLCWAEEIPNNPNEYIPSIDELIPVWIWEM